MRFEKARLQPCRKGLIKPRALAPEVRSLIPKIAFSKQATVASHYRQVMTNLRVKNFFVVRNNRNADVRKYANGLSAPSHHCSPTRRVVRTAFRLQRDREGLGLYSGWQRRIHYARAPIRVWLEQSCRDGCSAALGKQPQLVNLVRRQRSQIACHEHQAISVPQIER